MRAGRRHNPILIEEGIDTPGVNGGAPTIVWRKFREVFAEVKEKLQRQMYEGGQRYEYQSFEFACFFLDVNGIKPKMRIRWNGETYRITGFHKDHERKNYIKIAAEIIPDDTRLTA